MVGWGKKPVFQWNVQQNVLMCIYLSWKSDVVETGTDKWGSSILLTLFLQVLSVAGGLLQNQRVLCRAAAAAHVGSLLSRYC